MHSAKKGRANVLLFVMVDGWALLCGGVAASFRQRNER